MKTPKVIVVVRLLIIGTWGLVTYFFLQQGMLGIAVTRVVISSSIFSSALILSFVRSRWSLWALAFLATAVPLFFWLLFNTSGIVRGTWWEWLIIFPAQMIIPVSLTYTLLTDKNVRTYFCWRISNQ
jgi:hypothetical protein